MYSLPVLLSGIPSLILSSSELNIIDGHYRKTLNSLLKLYPSTPHTFTYLIAGSLPAKAIVHQRQLGLFNMICNLPDDPLHRRAKYVLVRLPPSHKSWFSHLRDICLLYGLPHPLELLNNPLSKESFKKLVKSKIRNYWEEKLRCDTLSLSSLVFFKPAFYSLTRSHPILWTPGPNPYEVSKAIIQCKMLSGRYRTELLASHWSQNKSGFCLSCIGKDVIEDLNHILLCCPSYQPAREKVKLLWLACAEPLPVLESVLHGSQEILMQFLLDPSVHPSIIILVQNIGDNILRVVFHLSRTWCYTVHKERSKLLGR